MRGATKDKNPTGMVGFRPTTLESKLQFLIDGINAELYLASIGQNITSYEWK